MVRFAVASLLVVAVLGLVFSVQAGDGKGGCSKGACSAGGSSRGSCSAAKCPASKGCSEGKECPVSAKACPASKCATCEGCPVKAAAASCSSEKPCCSKKPKDIVDTAAGAKDFKTLVKAVKAAGLVETLKGDGPYTVFAPTDKAFEKLPEGMLESLLKPENKEKLTAILTYHVVPGEVKAADIVKLKSAKTVQGSKVKIQVKDGKVKVDEARVVKTDIEAKNGVIHVIDAVILPN